MYAVSDVAEATYICVLISSDSDELSLREDKGLGFGREEGVLGAVFFHLHDVQTRLVFMERLEDYHLRMVQKKKKNMYEDLLVDF